MRYLVSFLLILAMPCGAQQVPEKTAFDSRYDQLGPAVNLGSWYWPNVAEIYDPSHAETRYTDTDLHLIKSLGFRHVRLTIVPEFLLNEQNPDAPTPWGLAHLDQAIDRILGQGLGVTVCFSAEPGSSFVNRLLKEPPFRNSFGRLWTSLGRHWSTRDPDRFFMEILELPGGEDPVSWDRIQTGLTRAIRAGAPRHTIIVGIGGGASPEQLADFAPIDDANVVYSTHLYRVAEAFSSQGSPRFPRFAGVSGLPYPVTPKAVLPLLEKLRDSGDAAGAELVEEYGDQRWNRDLVREAIHSIADWARDRRFRLVVDEIGAVVGAPPGHRLQFLRDTCDALKEAGIPWTFSEYDRLFTDGQTSMTNTTARAAENINRELLEALGLKP